MAAGFGSERRQLSAAFRWAVLHFNFAESEASLAAAFTNAPSTNSLPDCFEPAPLAFNRAIVRYRMYQGHVADLSSSCQKGRLWERHLAEYRVVHSQELQRESGREAYCTA